MKKEYCKQENLVQRREGVIMSPWEWIFNFLWMASDGRRKRRWNQKAF